MFPIDKAIPPRCQGTRGRGRGPIPDYGSPAFERLAEDWWIRRALKSMVELRTARREGDRWFIGTRAPIVYVVCSEGRRHAVPYDSKKGRAEDEAQRLRANIREDVREARAGKSVKAKDAALDALMEIS